MKSREEYLEIANAVISEALRQEELVGASIDVAFATPEEIRALNKKRRGVDAVTDVLSFPTYICKLDYYNRPLDTDGLLGDVIICLDKAAEQAYEHLHTMEREVGFLAVHGTLHCCWYDHDDPEDEAEMIERQKKVLARMYLSRGREASVLPRRKPNRLVEYDYSTLGAYFVTICTREGYPHFRRGGNLPPPTYMHPLTEVGETVEEHINLIPEKYVDVYVDSYAIMPNHVHIIIIIGDSGVTRQVAAPTLSRIINQFKRNVSIDLGFSPWQKGFADHVIRGLSDQDFLVGVIEDEQRLWREDRYFTDRQG